MNVLGIGSDVLCASACLLSDGVVIAAAAEERFDRQKASRAYPHQAIEFCLQAGNLPLEDIDVVAIGWNPGRHISFASPRVIDNVSWRGNYLAHVGGNLLAMLGRPEVLQTRLTFDISLGKPLDIVFVTHHLAHVSNSYFLSPFDSALAVSADGRGEDTSGAVAVGRGNELEILEQSKLPFSLGEFYAVLTDYLGYKPHLDEWKVMALAAFGNPVSGYTQALSQVLSRGPDGQIIMDSSYFTSYFVDVYPRRFTDKLVALLGPARRPGDPIEQRHMDIARAIQETYEEVMVHHLTALHERSKLTNLVLSGGCAMNTVFNGKVSTLTPFEEVFVSSCPDDSGISLGAALSCYYQACPSAMRSPQTHCYWGPSFTAEQIEALLQDLSCRYEVHDDIETVGAELLAHGYIVGWFQGAMEFSQRALGARSVLADPRNPGAKEKVNAKVKHREWFRPFAAAVLQERSTEFFDVPPTLQVPFMEKVVQVRSEARDLIPAVVHEDGTCRLQSVSRDRSPRFYKLILEFERRTGLPLVLNTSFNLAGEPVVCTPTDAIRTFYGSALDFVILDRFLVKK